MNSFARSYLFVPGNRPERFEKAMAAGADAVILDLEDAVPAADKDKARHAVAQWLSTRVSAPACEVLVRINACRTPQHEDDVRACRAGVSGLLLPKCEAVTDLASLARSLPGIALLPMIETAAGFAASLELARAPSTQRLVFGTIDFMHDLGLEDDGDALLYFRSQLVLSSRLAGLGSPVDGISTTLDDSQRIHAETHRARVLGFGAKLCIHPKQIAAVHAALAPTTAQLEWARRVLAAAEAAGGAAVALDGAMIDRAVILRAEALLRR